MNWIKNLSLVFCSILIGLTIFEFSLRIHGRYTSQVSQSVGGVDTIWTRSANSEEFSVHPSLGKKLTLKYDQYGSRVTEPVRDLKSTVVGLFGDSFTENRYIENKFTLTTILNDIVDGTSFLNFGVDGFGLEQSYAHYLKKRDILKFDKVFYIVCWNDLRNTYEVQLFDRKKMSDGFSVLKTNIVDVPWYIKMASKIHITYLLIEGYYKGISTAEVQVEQFAYRLGYRFSKGRTDHRTRFHDEYADSILNRVISGKESENDELIVDHFKATLNKWRSDVESSGAEFYVVVLPTEIARKMAKAIKLKGYLQLAGNEAFNELSGRPWKFENDNHWNEYGNLAAALSFINEIESFKLSETMQSMLSHYIVDHILMIDEQYGLVKPPDGS